MRNDLSQLAGLKAGLTIGLFLLTVHIVRKNLLVLGVESLLTHIYISWAVAIMATFFVSAIYFKNKIEKIESNRLAEVCFLREQMREVEGQLDIVSKEKFRLQLTRKSQDEEFEKTDHYQSLVIDSATYNRINRAISAFPTRYPEYLKKPPKLENDVRPWLKEVNIATNDREAFVFSTIIAEHFGF